MKKVSPCMRPLHRHTDNRIKCKDHARSKTGHHSKPSNCETHESVTRLMVV